MNPVASYPLGALECGGEVLLLHSEGTTHVGLVHHTNEDSWSIERLKDGVLLAVCDGMGGMGRGDEASAIAIQAIKDSLQANPDDLPHNRLRDSLLAADTTVREELCASGVGNPGSTAVLVAVIDGMAHVAWVGDSRAYLVRDGALLHRTRDHKFIEDLIDAGQITREEAKHSQYAHLVTRAIGGRPPSTEKLEPDSFRSPWKLNTDDRIMLCSDGVCDLVEDEEVVQILTEFSEPGAMVERLKELSLERGGHDNITCIAAIWKGPDFIEDDVATPIIPEMRSEDAETEHAEDPTTESHDEAEAATVHEEPRPAESEPEASPAPPSPSEGDQASSTTNTALIAGVVALVAVVGAAVWMSL